MLRKLVIYGDERLQKVSGKIEKIDDEILTLIDDMFETMYKERGVGLAAVQVGILKRLIVISVPDFDDEAKPDFKLALINPEIIWHGEEKEILEEGCLSFPEIRDDVARYTQIKVKYLDRDGNEQILDAENYIAKVLQHEIDHTNGITFIDRLESYQKRRLKRELKELRNNTVREIKKKENREMLKNSQSIKNIIFDLDGTLADSIFDIYNCVNTTLKHFNLETISLEDTHKFVGNGAKLLIKRAVNKYSNNEEIEEEAHQFYIKYYEEHCVDSTKLYDGVKETLDLLYNHNINMFVISNKPNKMAIKTVEKLNILQYFKAVIGDGVYPYRKPDVNIWHSLKKDYNLIEDETIMVGDGIPDYEFACNSSMKCLLALYGITDKNILLELKNNYYLNSFNEIADYIINKKF